MGSLRSEVVRSPNKTKTTTRTREDTSFCADEGLNSAHATVAKLIAGLKLIHVNEYHIFLDDLSTGHPSLFLHTAMWPLFGSTLESLSIDLRLEGLQEFLPLLSGIGSLKNLQISLRCRRSGQSGEVERKAAGLIRFINRHHHTLQSLLFSSLPVLDWFHIYNSLTYFPNLTTIDVAIPVNENDYRLHFSGLKHFLVRHNDIIQRLILKPLVTNDSNRVVWIGESLDDVVFGSLHTLQLSLEGRLSDSSEIAFGRIAQSAPAISSLALNDRDLLFDNAQALVIPFSGSRLTSLSFNAHILNPKLIDVLASHLPQLKKLHLTVCHIGGNEENEDNSIVVGFNHIVSRSISDILSVAHTSLIGTFCS